MKNRNLFRPRFVAPHRVDGTVNTLPVDQFPVSNKGLFKDDGFPMTDIGILDRFSQDMAFDEDYVKLVASRIEPITDKVTGLTLEQEIKSLRPSWVQTPSEYSQYSERVYAELASISSSDEAKEIAEKVSTESPVVDCVEDTEPKPE